MEDTFPWALIDAINARSGENVCAEPVQISALRGSEGTRYTVILDRISHEVPFYRTYLKSAVFNGTRVINNPFWWASDDKFFDNLVAEAIGVAVPRTVLLPHKEHPPNTSAASFRNLRFVDWEDLFEYVGFPTFLKPAYGGGWRDVYRCANAEEFFSAYDRTRDLCMMAQESIDFTGYYRCYVLGRSLVRVMAYDPGQPFHLRYVKDAPPVDPELLERMQNDAILLCRGLGYDMNTVEFAVRDGVPYAIDFMNYAPDADLHSVGRENFDWVVANTASLLIKAACDPRPFEITGIWPSFMQSDTGEGQRRKPLRPPNP
jgi:hypothetical protein